MVSGRIYSGVGMEDLDALRDGQLVLLCLFVREGWSPSTRLMETIQKWGEQDDHGLRAFVEQLKQWKIRLNEADFHAYQSLYSCLQPETDDADSLQNAIARLDGGIDLMIAEIDAYSGRT